MVFNSRNICFRLIRQVLLKHKTIIKFRRTYNLPLFRVAMNLCITIYFTAFALSSTMVKNEKATRIYHTLKYISCMPFFLMHLCYARIYAIMLIIQTEFY